jgi:hypothetical protein
MVLSIEERIFLVECVFRDGNRYTDLVQEQFAENFAETPPDFYMWGGGGGQKAAVACGRPLPLNA